MITFTIHLFYLLVASLIIFSTHNLLAQTPIVNEYQKELIALDAEANSDELYLDVDQDVSVMSVPSYWVDSLNRYVESSLRIYENQGSKWTDVFDVSHYFHSVAVNQGVVVAGSLASNAVHVYEKKSGNWQQTAETRLPVSIMNDYINIGQKVAIADNIIAAHATTAAANPRRRTLHIFEKVNGIWKFNTILNQFSEAESFAISDEQIAVATGKVNEEIYLYDKVGSNWRLTSKLKPELDKAFRSIDINGNTIAASSAGSISIFKKSFRGKWSLSTKIQATDLPVADSIPLNANLRISYVSDTSIIAGTYVFKKQGGVWQPRLRLEASNRELLGSGSSDGKTTLFAASKRRGDGLPYTGSPYFFNAASPFLTINHPVITDWLAERELYEVDPIERTVVPIQDLYKSGYNLLVEAIEGEISGMEFRLEGPVSMERIDKTAPYTLFGEDDEKLAFNPQAGEYTLTATPYYETGGETHYGESQTVNYLLTEEEETQVFPNPVQEELFVQSSTIEKIVEVSFQSIYTKKKYFVSKSSITYDGETWRIETAELPAGYYILEIITPTEVITQHVLKK